MNYKKYGYRPIEGTEYYLINKKGLVWNGKHNKPRKWVDNGKGYQTVQINRKTHSIHREVWKAFKGPIPEGYEIDHLNKDIRNNDISNLECVSKAENLLRRF